MESKYLVESIGYLLALSAIGYSTFFLSDRLFLARLKRWNECSVRKKIVILFFVLETTAILFQFFVACLNQGCNLEGVLLSFLFFNLSFLFFHLLTLSIQFYIAFLIITFFAYEKLKIIQKNVRQIAVMIILLIVIGLSFINLSFDAGNTEMKECQYKYKSSISRVMEIPAILFGSINPSIRDSICYQVVAIKTLDVKLCERAWDKGNCYTSIIYNNAYNKKDASLFCEKANSPDSCYMDMAVANNNFALCEKSYFRNLCYRQIAGNLQNLELCKKIKWDSWDYNRQEEGYCSALFQFCSLKCHQIKESILKEACISSALDKVSTWDIRNGNERNAALESLHGENIDEFCRTNHQ